MASISGYFTSPSGQRKTDMSLSGNGICFEWGNGFQEIGIGAFTSHYKYYGDYGNGIVISYDKDVSATKINDIVKSQIKDRITYMKDILNISDSVENELKNIIDILDLYSIDINKALSGWYLPETSVIFSGIATAYNCPVGTMLNNDWNKYGSNIGGYTFNGISFTGYIGAPIGSIFNILSYAIENNIIEPSDDLINLINSQYVAIQDDFSFYWDVYINSYRENALYGGYKTESIIVRWSSNMVNKATEEYLQTNPDYNFRADNVLIELSANKSKKPLNSPFLTTLYGDLQAKIPIEKLAETTGTSEFIKGISSFIPTAEIGDIYLMLSYKYQDTETEHYRSDICIAQIPLNSTTQKTEYLYTENGRYGSIVRLHYGEPESGVDPSVVGWNDDVREIPDDDLQKFDDDSSDVESDISTNSNISLLTTTYAMTESNLKALGKKLWDNSFLENISMINNSPIENILSAKAFPYPIPTTGATSKNVILGNVDMNVTGNELPSSFIPIKTIGTFKVDKKFSGVLEWLNYHIEVICYLPYIGFVELNIKEIIDKTITLKYIYDVITGVCTACFYANNIEICKYSGTIAIDIPITASNRAQVESGYIMSALGAVGSLLTGKLMGFAGSAFGALMNQNHFTTKGSPSPSCDAFDEQKAFIIIDYPVYYPPTNYAHDYGYPCNLSMKLGNCKGFTKCANVDVDGLSCTEEERAELKRLLESGVYL